MEETPSECNPPTAAAASSSYSYLCSGLKPFHWLSNSNEVRAAFNKKHLGNLLVEKLPCDAWEKWCKDGVLCFGLNGSDVLKFYFGNPSDLSIYHVVDFSFSNFGMDPITSMNTICYTLVGSKIYVLGGTCNRRNTGGTCNRRNTGGSCNRRNTGGPVDVHYCNVANQSPEADGCYEWKDGPKLNTRKYNPLVFSLEDSVYVLCVGVDGSKSKFIPFEVLKPDSHKWELLDAPHSLTQNWDLPEVMGSFVCEDVKKILIYVTCLRGEILYIYDAGLDHWTQMESSLITGRKWSLPWTCITFLA